MNIKIFEREGWEFDKKGNEWLMPRTWIVSHPAELADEG